MTTDRDLWANLRQLTHARIALGRAGHSVPTRELLDFRLAHSRAKDSVWQEVDFASLRGAEPFAGGALLEVSSQCTDKKNFLLRPDLGRCLSAESLLTLEMAVPETPPDCVLVIADGLSAAAVDVNASAFAVEFISVAKKSGITLGPVVFARHARVALGDEIGSLLKSKSVLMLIGERPGLGSSESLSVYFTYKPAMGRTDADRNCISNIHSSGLPPKAAAVMAVYLAETAIKRQLSGVDLKVEYPGLTT